MTAGAKANIGTTGGGSGGAPTGPAGGDLSGTYPNPTVADIQGTPVDASAPQSNDFFTYTGAQWSHARIYTGLAAITSNTTASNGNVYPCDTTAGSFTVTLPASPATGAHIVVGLRTGTNALTISANTGQTINGSLASVQLTAAGQSLEFWYSGTGTTWNITSGLSVPPTATGFAVPAGGDLAGTYPAPTLTTTGVAAATYGTASDVPIITVDSKGRITTASTSRILTTGATLTTNTTLSVSTGTGTLWPCDTTSTAFTVTLPGVGTGGGKLIAIRLAAGSNVLTINAAASTTINGTLASIQLTDVGQSVFLTYSAAGAQWQVVSSSSVPAGASGFGVGGDLTGVMPNPSLAAVGTAGTYGSSTLIPVFTTDSKGRVTSVTNTAAAAVANNGFTSYSTTVIGLASATPTIMTNLSISGFTKYLVTFTNAASGTGSGTANAAIVYSCQMSTLSINAGGGTQTVGQLITTANTRGTYSYNTVITVSSTASDILSIIGNLGGTGNALNVAYHQVSVMGIS